MNRITHENKVITKNRCIHFGKITCYVDLLNAVIRQFSACEQIHIMLLSQVLCPADVVLVSSK